MPCVQSQWKTITIQLKQHCWWLTTLKNERLGQFARQRAVTRWDVCGKQRRYVSRKGCLWILSTYLKQWLVIQSKILITGYLFCILPCTCLLCVYTASICASFPFSSLIMHHKECCNSFHIIALEFHIKEKSKYCLSTSRERVRAFSVWGTINKLYYMEIHCVIVFIGKYDLKRWFWVDKEWIVMAIFTCQLS